MPAMSDVVIIVKNQGRIFLAGPPLVKAATGEIVDEETLGRWRCEVRLTIRWWRDAHVCVGSSGSSSVLRCSCYSSSPRSDFRSRIHLKPASDTGTPQTGGSISLILQNSTPRPPLYSTAELDSIVPEDSRQTIDMREVIARITDGSEFREFKQEYGKTLITVSSTSSCIANADASGICGDTWPHCWDHRQRRRALIPISAESDPLYPALLSTSDPFGISGQCQWIHGR